MNDLLDYAPQIPVLWGLTFSCSLVVFGEDLEFELYDRTRGMSYISRHVIYDPDDLALKASMAWAELIKRWLEDL